MGSLQLLDAVGLTADLVNKKVLLSHLKPLVHSLLLFQAQAVCPAIAGNVLKVLVFKSLLISIQQCKA